MKKDNWMTDFYGINWYRINNLDELEDVSDEKALIEYVVDVNSYSEIYKLQTEGFKIVETDIEFETLINTQYETKPNIRVAIKDDLPEILEITKSSYLEHDKFFNRFRNEDFFTKDQAWYYYRESVVNNFNLENTITVVVDDDDGVCAYYIIKKIGELSLYHRYKGIISGVNSRGKGKSLHLEMQRKITEIINTPYITNNRTQLGNYRVIDNHLKENRQLSKIEHICYKKVGNWG